MEEVGNLDTCLWCYLDYLSRDSNLDANLEDSFKLLFITVNVGNLNANLDSYFMFLQNGKGGYFIENILDLMVIRVY